MSTYSDAFTKLCKCKFNCDDDCQYRINGECTAKEISIDATNKADKLDKLKDPINVIYKEDTFLDGYCPVCKRGIHVTYIYCPQCGQSLKWYKSEMDLNTIMDELKSENLK